MLTVPLAVVALASGVVGLMVRRWWLCGLVVVLVVLASLDAGRVPLGAAEDGVEAMAFVAGMVIVGAALEQSGVLAALADRAVRSSHSAGALLAATFLVAVVLTTFANLDTTALLMTPLAIEVGLATGLALTPFALAVILGANFGSMLLPTSNLTNLVVWRHAGQTVTQFARTQAPIAAAAAVLTLFVVLAVGRYHQRDAPDRSAVIRAPTAVLDPVLARASLAAIGLLIVAVAAGAPVGLTSIAIGSVLILLRPRLGHEHIDPRLVVAAVGVFCAAGVIASSLDTAGRLAGVDPLGLAALGAVLGMAGTNLAATLLLNPAATTVPLRSGLLIGVNLGVGLTPVASLATILWGDSLRSRGVPVPWRGFLIVGVPLSVTFVLLAGFLS